MYKETLHIWIFKHFWKQSQSYVKLFTKKAACKFDLTEGTVGMFTIELSYWKIQGVPQLIADVDFELKTNG